MAANVTTSVDRQHTRPFSSKARYKGRLEGACLFFETDGRIMFLMTPFRSLPSGSAVNIIPSSKPTLSLFQLCLNSQEATMTKLGALFFAIFFSSVSLIASDPPHCLAQCVTMDHQYSYCIQKGCCGFAHVDLTTPTGTISENGTGTVDAAQITIQSPQTHLDVKSASDAYHGTLVVTPTGQTQSTTLDVSCPLIFGEDN